MIKIIKHTSKAISLVIILILFTFANCRKMWQDKELTLPLRWYLGTDLELDGYYHYDSDGRSEINIFYRNGVILYGGAPLFNDVGARELEFQNGTYYGYAKDSKTNWGRFIIDGSIIKFEKWGPSSGGPVQTYLYSGTILNDTTFQITTSQDAHGEGDVHSVNYLYHFKKFSPKPDSTNTFTD